MSTGVRKITEWVSEIFSQDVGSTEPERVFLKRFPANRVSKISDYRVRKSTKRDEEISGELSE